MHAARKLCKHAGEGFKAWKDMPHLISISLHNSTSITDSGLAALATLKPLKSLNLKGCRDVSDEGMAALQPLQQLTFLRIQVNKITLLMIPAVWKKAHHLHAIMIKLDINILPLHLSQKNLISGHPWLTLRCSNKTHAVSMSTGMTQPTRQPLFSRSLYSHFKKAATF